MDYVYKNGYYHATDYCNTRAKSLRKLKVIWKQINKELYNWCKQND